jgi:hypothetical protein
MPRVRISNVTPRLTTTGQIADCHDGCLHRFDGLFHWYGTAYGNTDGFTPANRYVVFTSPDLHAWTPHAPLLADAPPGVYYRPYVLYDPTRRRYVLWFNWYPKLWDGQYGIATSPTPAGPFTLLESNRHLARAKGGDFGLFLDDDAQGYIVYTSIAEGHSIRVERLTPDLTAGTGEMSEELARACEAPTMFKHNGRYFVLTDDCCCFCPAGSGARLYSAANPLGPYTFHHNLNRTPDHRPIIPAQQTHLARIPTPSGDKLLWMGDRWHSRPDGIKGHDFQYWSEPLDFDPAGLPKPIRWSDAFDLDI